MAAASTHGIYFMDFLPKCLSEGGIFEDPRFERFPPVISRANAWLRRQSGLGVKTAESIEIKHKSLDGGYIDSDKTTFTEHGKKPTHYLRALRLWLVPDDNAGEPPQIGYYNVAPVCTAPGDIFDKPRYESLGTTLERLNTYLSQNPLPGAVINVETQDMKFHTSTQNVDPDETYWREGGKRGTNYITVVRVFYQIGVPAYEQIGCADFIPESLGGSTYQRFREVVAQANRWIREHSHLRVVSLQSMDYKLKEIWLEESKLDTHRTMYYEQGKYKTKYLRIVRLSYVVSQADREMPVDTTDVRLSYKTFIPYEIPSSGIINPSYEGLGKTMKRVTRWVELTGAEVISAETVPVRLTTGRQDGDPEVTYTRNYGNQTDRWLSVIRLYLKGSYREPPASALPQPPRVNYEDDGDCCVLS